MSIEFKDRVVEFPNRYNLTQNGDGTVTLTPDPGTVVEPGTPLNANNLNQFNEQLVEITQQLDNYNSYASVKDANGIYTVVEYKRADGTLYMKSVLSGGTSPNYITNTWSFYNALGTVVVATKVWTITYDADGKIISKVVV